MKSIMFIINPKAGDEKNERIENTLNLKFKDHFDALVYRYTKTAFDATKYAASACRDRFDSICVIGGDGTLNEVIEGMYREEYRPKLAIIPGGTVNCLARLLEMPMNKKNAIKSIDLNRTTRVDIGVVNERCFGYMLSIGAVPEAIHEVSTEEKTKFGPMAYFVNSSKKLSNAEVYNLRVKTDSGEFSGKVDHLIVSLVNKFGTYEFSGVDGDTNDGVGHVFILKENNIFDKLSLLGNVIMGNIENNENIIHFATRNVEIESLDGSKVETDVDGENGELLPVKVKILKQHIEVYLPGKVEEILN